MLMTALTAYSADFTETKGKPYSRAGERCVMDIYHPAEVTGEALPVIVWFHGGGLTGGHWKVPSQLKTGKYVVVAPGYRLIPDVKLDDCIDDAAAAVAWVMDSIAAYGGDPRRVFVSGHSAGGYLTSMIGLDRSRLRKYGKEADSIAGLLPVSGQVITHFAHRKQQGVGELTPMVDDKAPLFYVRPDAPPYVIITGDREEELYGRYEENAYMWRMMKLTGHPEVYIYEIGGHDHGKMVGPALHIVKKHVDRLSATQ